MPTPPTSSSSLPARETGVSFSATLSLARPFFRPFSTATAKSRNYSRSRERPTPGAVGDFARNHRESRRASLSHSLSFSFYAYVYTLYTSSISLNTFRNFPFVPRDYALFLPSFSLSLSPRRLKSLSAFFLNGCKTIRSFWHRLC